MVKNKKKSTKNKKEKYPKSTWSHCYDKHKPAMRNRRTGKIKYPSKGYIKKHHPQGPWDS